MFEEQAAYFASLQGPSDHSYLAELGARFGVSVVGPPAGRVAILTSMRRRDRPGGQRAVPPAAHGPEVAART
jgi:hypothetical protein